MGVKSMYGKGSNTHTAGGDCEAHPVGTGRRLQRLQDVERALREANTLIAELEGQLGQLRGSVVPVRREGVSAAYDPGA